MTTRNDMVEADQGGPVPGPDPPPTPIRPGHPDSSELNLNPQLRWWSHLNFSHTQVGATEIGAAALLGNNSVFHFRKMRILCGKIASKIMSKCINNRVVKRGFLKVHKHWTSLQPIYYECKNSVGKRFRHCHEKGLVKTIH